MTPSHDAPDDPTAPADQIGLADYVEICRALVRHGGDTERRMDEVLGGFGVSPIDWAIVSAVWTERIRSDPAVRSEFQRLYVGPANDPPKNE